MDLSLKKCLANQITPIIYVIPVMTSPAIFSDIWALFLRKQGVLWCMFQMMSGAAGENVEIVSDVSDDKSNLAWFNGGRCFGRFSDRSNHHGDLKSYYGKQAAKDHPALTGV